MRTTLRALGALGMGFGVAAAMVIGTSGLALAQTNSNATDGSDALRTGGCSGCFFTQMTAAIATFSNIKRVFRVCGTGGGFSGADGCDGGLQNGNGGNLQDFIMLQGDLRNSNTHPDGLGVPGGAANVTYRVSANGSGNGFACSRSNSPVGIGFIAPEGLDGVPTGLNAGGGAFGTPMDGAADFATRKDNLDGADNQLGTADDLGPGLVRCTNTLTEFPNDTSTTMSFAGNPSNQLCVVNYDFATVDGQISNDRAGVPVGTATVGSVAGNETTNLRLSCDLGFGDLPPADFESASTNQISLKNPDVFGAQIFKLVASRDLSSSDGGPTSKIALQNPQIENIFGPSGANSVCSPQNLGAVSSVAAPAPPGPTLTACFRAAGSGSRETYRNTFHAKTKGRPDKGQGAGTSTGVTSVCAQVNEAGANVLPPPFKRMVENGGGGDVVNCVANNPRAIGYIDADRQPPTAANEFYDVPVEGVDPQTNNLKRLVRCGLYRFWGPLSGGEGSKTAALTAAEAAHRAALKNSAPFVSADAYMPLGAVAYTKTLVDGAYILNFAPTNCPGQIVPPAAIP